MIDSTYGKDVKAAVCKIIGVPDIPAMGPEMILWVSTRPPLASETGISGAALERLCRICLPGLRLPVTIASLLDNDVMEPDVTAAMVAPPAVWVAVLPAPLLKSATC